MSAIKTHILLLAVGSSLSAVARSPVSTGLPPATYVDTETTTNVPFIATEPQMAHFAFELAFAGTASNNVEVAFGTDVDANGELSLAETDLVIGWDCGEWFAYDGRTARRFTSPPANSEPWRSLSWKVELRGDGSVKRVEAHDGAMTILEPFTAISPSIAHRHEWNLVRLTGRGTDVLSERFFVQTTPRGTSYIFR